MAERLLVGWGNKAEVFALSGNTIGASKIKFQKIIKHSYTGAFLNYKVEIEHNRFDPEFIDFLKEYAPVGVSEAKEDTYEDGSKEMITASSAKRFFFISYGAKNADGKVPVYVMVGTVSPESGTFDTGADTPVRAKTVFASVKADGEIDYKSKLDTSIVNPGTADYTLAAGANGDLVWIDAAV